MSFNFVIPEFNIGGAGTPPLQFFRRGFNLNGSSGGGWTDIILSGNTALTLTNAKANGLNYLKLFGGTEQLPETYLDTVTLSGGCEQRNLPVGYTQVEYIEATGTQYIDTGLKQQGGDEFGLVYQQVELDTAYRNLFGASVSGQTNEFYISQTSTTTYVGNVSDSNIPRDTNKHTLSWITTSYSNQNVVIDGQTYSVSARITPNPDLNVMLFARNANQSKMVGKVYGYYQKRNGEYLINLVPAKNSSNVLGMYDLVSGQFLTNQGTDDFTAGAEAVPSPDTPIDIVSNNGALKAVSPSGLPEGHTELEYIEFTGSQYVDTGIKSVQNKEFGIVAQQTELLSGFPTILGALDSSDSNYKVVFGYGSSSKFYTQCGIEGPSYTIGLTQNTNKHTFKVVNTTNSAQLTIDNDVYTGSYAITSTETYSLFIGARNRANVANYSKQKVWSFYEKINGEYTHYYVPDKYNDTLGFYDTVTDEFMPVVGSGAVGGNPVWTLGVKGTVETVTDSNGLTATAQMLLSVNDYKDTQEILSGVVTRNVGIKVLDGTEVWKQASNVNVFNVQAWDTPLTTSPDRLAITSTHFVGTNETNANMPANSIKLTNSTLFSSNGTITIKSGTYDTLTDWTQFLADQYANGTPVIVVYPLATATTESATPQLLTKSPVTQTAGSIDNLPIAITESQKTVPTPQQPLPINCNNGVLKVSPNLANFVSGNIVLGYGIDNATGQQASTPSKTNFYCPQYIPVQGGESYVFCGRKADNTLSEWNRIHWYDSSKTFISTCSYTHGRVTIATAPANAVYARISCNPLDDSATLTQAMVDSFNWVFQKGTAEPTYMPYGQIYVDGTTETVEVTGKNLYNTSTRTNGYYIGADGTIAQGSGTFCYSALIPVKPNTNYMLSGIAGQTDNRRLHAYDSSGNWISQIIYARTSAENTYNITGTTPNNCVYVRISIPMLDTNVQLELGSTATTYEPYYNGGTATAEDLLKVGTYQDVQSVLDGEVTRKVGIKVLDGTENWSESSSNIVISGATVDWGAVAGAGGYCTHLTVLKSGETTFAGACRFAGDFNIYAYTTAFGVNNITQFKQYLANQYQAGSPVIVVYPLATATTETVTAQPLTIQAGGNVVSITEASMDNLGLEVSYKGKEGG